MPARPEDYERQAHHEAIHRVASEDHRANGLHIQRNEDGVTVAVCTMAPVSETLDDMEDARILDAMARARLFEQASNMLAYLIEASGNHGMTNALRDEVSALLDELGWNDE